jgi:hypothetical protein
MPLSEKLLKILVCPKCREPLEYRAGENRLICASCGVAYPVTDDVPVLLIEEAIRLK